MPLANSSGPRWVRTLTAKRSTRARIAAFIARFFGSTRGPLAKRIGGKDEPGATGGAAVKRLEDEY